MGTTAQVRWRIRDGLLGMGGTLPASSVRALGGATNFLEMGSRLRADGMRPARRVATRQELFDLAILLLNQAQAPLYLEFGVWEGESIEYIARNLIHPNARLVGFDSFVGLPEEWTEPGFPAGFFSTAGEAPNIDDPRVRFVAGWFDESLPAFEVPAHDRLLINVDCDLYSSAKTVLAWAGGQLQVGDLLYFDEFGYRDNEFRAFTEFLDASGQRFEMLGATRGLVNALLRRVG